MSYSINSSMSYSMNLKNRPTPEFINELFNKLFSESINELFNKLFSEFINELFNEFMGGAFLNLQ